MPPSAAKLVLRCRYTLGDIVLLTAAVRDLHLGLPGRYQTDVRTGFTEVWEHNPYLTSLDEYEPGVRVIDCDLPLVERSDEAGKHALCGFIDFLSDQLAVKLRLTDFRGDIHLSAEECDRGSWLSELTGQEVPYWLLNAGGKHDCTVKWWNPERFQRVVDHFHGRIQFAQVGRIEDWHPKLRGVIDLRGRTRVRDLVRLVHHADGVVCGVTAVMHLAAAVPRASPIRGARPCVVIAGGREPPHWEAYPGHQFIHTIGALACCASSGCWTSRTRPLGDGQDAPERMCLDVRGEWPACMDLIREEEVIRRIELYLTRGGTLSPAEATRAAQATAWSDQQPAVPVPVTFHSAPQAAAAFIARIPPCPDRFAGRGIVICGGGARMYANAWVCIHRLRKVGCTLPIELWHLGETELDATMAELVRPLGVTCVDATAPDPVWPATIDGGWPLKPFALINSRFEEVLLLDADNMAVRNPEFLFTDERFRAQGAILWPDEGRLPKDSPAWRLFDVEYRDEPEVESGQVLLNKGRCWAPLLLCMWYNEHKALFYQHVYGDKETFHFAFRRLGMAYAMTPHPVRLADGAFYQHDFEGDRLFQHRHGDKWDLLGRNRSIPDFIDEPACRELLRDLARRWDGRVGWLKAIQANAPPTAAAALEGRLELAVAMASCAERERPRADTLRQLAAAGWPEKDVLVAIDERRFANRVERVTHTAWRALRSAWETGADYALFLQDDLELNRHLLDNLRRWSPLARRDLDIGSLCNLGHRELTWDVPGCAYLVHPGKVLGAQAVLFSRRMLGYCLEHWFAGPPELHARLAFLAAQARQPFFFHCPSLVQHAGRDSTLGHRFMEAVDFDAEWRAAAEPAIAWISVARTEALSTAGVAHG